MGWAQPTLTDGKEVVPFISMLDLIPSADFPVQFSFCFLFFNACLNRQEELHRCSDRGCIPDSVF